jgi:predicted DNA-binding transcriptional regulator AlpA
MTELLPDSLVAKRYGVSSMTLWRWDRDSELNFPKPIRIRGRKYRYAEELAEFDARRVAARDAGDGADAA